MMRVILSPYLLVVIVFALQPFTTCAEIYELPAEVGESLNVNCSPDKTYEFWTDWKLTEVEVIPGEGFRIPNVTADLDGQYFGCNLRYNGVQYDNYTVWHLNVSGIISPTTPTPMSDKTTSPPGSVTQEVRDDYTHTPGVGTHKIHNQAKTWNEARKICQAEGGDLAVINSINESQALAELIAMSYPHNGSYSSSYVLVGFEDIKQEGKHVTVDGRSLEEAGFAVWASGQPDDSTKKSEEDCGSISTGGKLNDVSCDKKFAFACELPVADEDPVRLEDPVIKHNGIPGNEVGILRGENLKLDCEITVPEGDKFTLKWKVPTSAKTRMNFNNDRIHVSNDTTLKRNKWKSKLTISSVEVIDRGEYICVAEGAASNSSSSIKVLVWERGNITGGEGPRVKLNQSANLSCHVDGYPLSNFNWSKIDGSKKSKPSGIENPLPSNPNNASVEMNLNFRSVTRRDNGTYECSAIDHIGTITGQTSLIVVEVPEVHINFTKSDGANTVFLNWTVYDGNEPLTMYSIQQEKEGTNQWKNCVGNISVNKTSFVARELEKNTTYRFRITATNSIGTSNPEFSNSTKTRKEDPPVFVPEAKVEKKSPTTYLIKWDKPPAYIKEFVHFLKVTATAKNDIQVRMAPANVVEVVFEDLESGVTYIFTVTGCNNYTGNCEPQSPASDTGVSQVTLWISVSVSALVVFVVMGIWMRIRKRRDLASRRRFMEATLVRFRIGAIRSLDPKLNVADQAELLPYDKKWEFSKKQLKLGKVLGSGAFGIVKKGQANSICRKQVVTTVAVKMVRATHSLDHMMALQRELKILAHLGKHLNIVNLLGACTTRISYGELFVIVEFCRFGNLHDYLLRRRDYFVDQIDAATGTIVAAASQSNSIEANDSGINTLGLDNISASGNCDKKSDTVAIDNPDSEDDYVTPDEVSPYQGDFEDQDLKPISTRDLLSWAWQVSRGMKYLTSRKVVHGDLAARNILLADNKVVKICDFGLAKSLYADDVYKKEGQGPLPIKWMAIESIRDRVFSIKSDVWSFGVVLWEFFTLAETPYPGITNESVYRKLVEGHRMERPKYATDDIYNMMLRSWNDDPSARPSFAELEEWIESFLEEKIKTDYMVLDAPYAELNAKELANGQKDYLTMKPSEYPSNSEEPTANPSEIELHDRSLVLAEAV